MSNEIIEAEDVQETEVHVATPRPMTPIPIGDMLKNTKLPASVEQGIWERVSETLMKVRVAQASERMIAPIVEYFLKLASDPIFAERAVYAKPVNKDMTQFVYGPSAYLADELANVFPHITVRTIEHGAVDGEDQIEVVVWDMQANNYKSNTWRVSHKKWDSFNKVAKEEPNPSKVHDMVKAEMSKLRRNTLLQVIPRAITDPVFEACRQTLDQEMIKQEKDKDKYFGIYAQKLGVTEAQILAFLGCKDLKSVKGPDLRRLKHIYQGIASGEIAASDVWKGAKQITVRKEETTETEKSTTSSSKQKSTTKPEKDSTSGSTDTEQAETSSEPSSTSAEPSTSFPSEKQSHSQSQDTSSSTETETSEPAESTSQKSTTEPKKKILNEQEAADIKKMFK